ncbi:Albumin-2 like [Actinidia chinensis var. chinensis]|uniref:Albumin-2 like n=1 Tax=Actinidia chinensis var. chinensis TaxID=1590841 RepID=A0A2R6QAC2_ACTCC|nr:Albumin-2 like [Actinidia chinensis var. chinensis]
MSIPPDAAERGCAANYPQPVSEDDRLEAQFWLSTLYHINCQELNPPLHDIVYRSSSQEEDIRRHVFRWDLTPYQEVFENGFRARRQEGTRDVDYVNLYNYVHHGGRPLDSRRETTYVFISTTISSGWHPSLEPGTDITVFRYEIYAPGGIWVAQALGNRYQYPSQDEVCFVEGVARQYIRSAQTFRLVRERGSRYTRMERRNDTIIYNRYFNPEAQPQACIQILNPVTYYIDRETRQRQRLEVLYYPERERDKREVSNDPADWYAVDAANYESYINAAFRSSRRNEAYLFMNNKYVLLNYAPGTTDDRVVNGPLLICEGYPSLTDTTFAEHGIDCAFGSYKENEAFIISGNLCALINYAPGTTDDKIIKGPMTIAAMFGFLKWTAFEKGVDAAFEATAKGEAYLFRGDLYALINYNDPHLIAIREIKQGFPSLKGTIFESGIEAAFASHRTDEAYIFKGDSYALINFAPGTTGDYIIGGVKKILPNWPSLVNILPVKNGGLDVNDHTKPQPDRDQDKDEL